MKYYESSKKEKKKEKERGKNLAPDPGESKTKYQSGDPTPSVVDKVCILTQTGCSPSALNRC